MNSVIILLDQFDSSKFAYLKNPNCCFDDIYKDEDAWDTFVKILQTIIREFVNQNGIEIPDNDDILVSSLVRISPNGMISIRSDFYYRVLNKILTPIKIFNNIREFNNFILLKALYLFENSAIGQLELAHILTSDQNENFGNSNLNQDIYVQKLKNFKSWIWENFESDRIKNALQEILQLNDWNFGYIYFNTLTEFGLITKTHNSSQCIVTFQLLNQNRRLFIQSNEQIVMKLPIKFKIRTSGFDTNFIGNYILQSQKPHEFFSNDEEMRLSNNFLDRLGQLYKSICNEILRNKNNLIRNIENSNLGGISINLLEIYNLNQSFFYISKIIFKKASQYIDISVFNLEIDDDMVIYLFNCLENYNGNLYFNLG